MHEGAKQEHTPDSWKRRESGERRVGDTWDPPRSTTFEVSRAEGGEEANDRVSDADPWMNTEELPTEPKASAQPLSEPPDTLRPTVEPFWDPPRDTIPAPPPHEDE